jgi:hypothetical protein
MLKEPIMTGTVIGTIIFCIILLIVLLVNGCSLLPTGGNSITTIPSAGQQLWKAAKDSNWLVTVSILGIAAGAFAFLNGSKMGLPCIGASCISLFMALAVARFSMWMAVFGLIGSLASVCISVLVKNRAVKEIVIGGQAFKEDDRTSGDSKHLFNALQFVKQSKSTQKLVQNIKLKLKLEGKI